MRGDLRLMLTGFYLEMAGRVHAASSLCRDEKGQFVGASVVVVEGQTDPSCLEATASVCNEGFAPAHDLNIDAVTLASDCLQAVANYHKKALCSYMMILREMEHRASSFRRTGDFSS